MCMQYMGEDLQERCESLLHSNHGWRICWSWFWCCWPSSSSKKSKVRSSLLSFDWMENRISWPLITLPCWGVGTVLFTLPYARFASNNNTWSCSWGLFFSHMACSIRLDWATYWKSKSWHRILSAALYSKGDSGGWVHLWRCHWGRHGSKFTLNWYLYCGHKLCWWMISERSCFQRES